MQLFVLQCINGGTNFTHDAITATALRNLRNSSQTFGTAQSNHEICVFELLSYQRFEDRQLVLLSGVIGGQLASDALLLLRV